MAFWVGLGMLTAPYGYTSQTVEEGQRRLLFDHDAQKVYSAGVGIKELETEILGETIDVGTGELTLVHTDISIPGNSKLPVNFIRVATRDPNRPSFFGNPTSTKSLGLGNFHLDAAYLLLPSISDTGIAGCISKSTEVDGSDEMYVTPIAYLPHDSSLLLRSDATQNADIYGKKQPEYTTRSMARVEQTKNGGKCSWLLTETNGNVYEFGQVRVIETKAGKKKHAVLVTKISDVHSNWIKFTYGGKENRLEKISSNDDRIIVVNYNSDGTVRSATENYGSKTTSPIVWEYVYGSVSGGSGLKYLKIARIQGTRYFWEYNELSGITSHQGNKYARRCTFGTSARVRHPYGLVAEYTFEKIVNFEQAQSSSGHLGTSHRAACLPPTDLFNNVGTTSNALKSPSIKDGTSSFGYFSTFFSAGLVRKKLKFLDATSAVWTIRYDEGDLYNASSSIYAPNKTVHKSQINPVLVDITKPKVRTITDPLGQKYVVKIGRSLNDSGLLISKAVFGKGKSEPALLIENEYVHSKKRLGYTWNRSKTNLKSAEYWVRMSKQKLTQNGTTYTNEYEYNVYGLHTKLTKSSTLQTGLIIEKTAYTNLMSKWIIGLVILVSKNGREYSGASYNNLGQKVLETKFGEDYMRYSWNYDGTLATKRNSDNNDTNFSNYKRGIPQTIAYSNGSVELQVVDDSGRIVQKTSKRNYVEKIGFNSVGWISKIDRPEGKTVSGKHEYADTKITYKWPSSTKGLVKTETTESNNVKGNAQLCKQVITTYNAYGLPILIETRDTTNNISKFERIRYDKLGREIFRSFPSTYSTETSGTETTFDVLGRETKVRENVPPYKTETTQYMSGNKTKFIDSMGSTRIVHRSGYGSPDDGKETQIIEANGRKTFKTYDNWLNLSKVRYVGNSKTYTIQYKYNSHNQLCLVTIPESGSTLIEYNSSGNVSRTESNVSKNQACKKPVKVSINQIFYGIFCSTYVRKIKVGGVNSSDYEYRASIKCLSFIPFFPGIFFTPGTTNTPSTAPIPTSMPSSTGSSSPTPKTSLSAVPATSLTPTCQTGEVFNGEACVNLLSGGKVQSELIQSRTGILYQYNDNFQLTKIDYPNNNTSDIFYTYDIAGNLIEIVRGNITLEYHYRKNGQLKGERLTITELDSNNKKIKKSYSANFSFNEFGGRSLYYSPKNRFISIKLNSLNQPKSLSAGKITLVSDMKYYPNNMLKSALIHSTNTSQNSKFLTIRNTLNWRKQISKTELLDGNTKILSFSNTYYKDGRVKSVTNNVAKQGKIGNRMFTYDSMNQLKSAIGDNRSITYSYDLLGNLIAQKGKSRTFTNKFDSITSQIIMNQTRLFDSEGQLEGKNDQAITNDKLGRITKIGTLSLSYNDANELIRAERDTDRYGSNSSVSSNVQRDTLEITNDGNGNRAKIDHFYIPDIKDPNSKVHVKIHEFRSLTGNLLFQTISQSPAQSGNVSVSQVIGDYDFIKIDSIFTLSAKKCLNWIISNPTNNYTSILNADLSVQRNDSVGPYGNSWYEKQNTLKSCEYDTTIFRPPTLRGPFFPIGFGLSNSPTSSDATNNLELEDPTSYLFQDSSRDNVTELYFLKTKRYFHSALGRYITPYKTEFTRGIGSTFYNKYSVAKNDPVNFNYQSNLSDSLTRSYDSFGQSNIELQNESIFLGNTESND